MGFLTYWKRRIFGASSVGDTSGLTSSSVRQWLINWAQGTSSDSTADKLSAYFACKKVIAEDVSKIPVRVVRVDGDTRTPLPNHPIRKLLNREPNHSMLATPFKELLLHWAFDYGGGIAEIQRDGREEPVAMWPIHPSRVRILDEDMENVKYQVTNNDGSFTILNQEDVFHVQGFSKDGINGYSMLGIMNEVLNFGLEIQRFGNAFLKNNAIPPMIIQPQENQIKKENLEELRLSWAQRYSGTDNSGKTAFFSRPMQIDTFDINQETAQVLENKKFNVVDIARFARMNPDKIMDWENANYNTLEASSTSHVDNIMSWVVRFEQESDRKLQTEAEYDAGNIETKFVIAALLRSDLQSRSAFYRELFNIGVFSQNEIRALEDLSPIENGDLHYVQGAMIPTDIYQEWVDGEREGLTGGGTNQNNTAADGNGNGKIDVDALIRDALLNAIKGTHDE